MQHHDAITGTESPAVKDMYVEHLTAGMRGVHKLMASIILDQLRPPVASSGGDATGPVWEGVRTA